MGDSKWGEVHYLHHIAGIPLCPQRVRQEEPRITVQAAYLSLGADDVTRLDAYRRLFASMDAHDIDALCLHTQQQKPWGSERS